MYGRLGLMTPNSEGETQGEGWLIRGGGRYLRLGGHWWWCVHMLRGSGDMLHQKKIGALRSLLRPYSYSNLYLDLMLLEFRPRVFFEVPLAMLHDSWSQVVPDSLKVGALKGKSLPRGGEGHVPLVPPVSLPMLAASSLNINLSTNMASEAISEHLYIFFWWSMPPDPCSVWTHHHRCPSPPPISNTFRHLWLTTLHWLHPLSQEVTDQESRLVYHALSIPSESGGYWPRVPASLPCIVYTLWVRRLLTKSPG